MVREAGAGQAAGKKSALRAELHVAEARTAATARACSPKRRRGPGELRIVADPPLIVPIEDLIVPGSEWEDRRS